MSTEGAIYVYDNLGLESGPADGAIYIHDATGTERAPADGAIYILDNVTLEKAPADGSIYVYDNPGVERIPADSAIYFYDNVLVTGYGFHFELRADTASGATDTVSVEVIWVEKSGQRISLGTFTSYLASPSGDASWRPFLIGVSEHPIERLDRVEIRRVGGNDNAHIRNVWIATALPPTSIVSPTSRWLMYDPWTVFAEQPTSVYRTKGDFQHCARVFDNDTGGVDARFGVGVPLPEGTSYYVEVWVLGDPNDGASARHCYLEMQSSLTTAQFILESNVSFNTTTWTKLSGTFTVPAGQGENWDILLQADAGLYIPGGWGFYVSDWTVHPVEAGSLYNYSYDYGAFPRGFPYTADVQDGVYNGDVILNDGGSSGQEYYAESGQPVDPSDYNYTVSFGAHNGSRVDQIDSWVSTGARWLCNEDGAYQSGREDQGTPNLNFLTRDWYTALRPDGFSGAPRHNINGIFTTYGSRGMSDIGPIWGWNSWNDFYFALAGDHGRGGVYRKSGGAVTQISTIHGGSNEIHVQHDFLTGDLHVEWVDHFFGTHVHYNGNHPHSVGSGHAGFIADRQDSSLGFWDTTLCTAWSNIFEPGHIAHQRQFSMRDLAVVEQDPPTWYFGPLVVPPLRQRSRDDGLATDTRQEKGHGSSQQLSLRRGGRVYY